MVVVGGAGARGVKKFSENFVCDRQKVFHSESESVFAQE